MFTIQESPTLRPTDRSIGILLANGVLFRLSIPVLCFKRILTLPTLHGTLEAMRGIDTFTITAHKEFAMIEYL